MLLFSFLTDSLKQVVNLGQIQNVIMMRHNSLYNKTFDKISDKYHSYDWCKSVGHVYIQIWKETTTLIIPCHKLNQPPCSISTWILSNCSRPLNNTIVPCVTLCLQVSFVSWLVLHTVWCLLSSGRPCDEEGDEVRAHAEMKMDMKSNDWGWFLLRKLFLHCWQVSLTDSETDMRETLISNGVDHMNLTKQWNSVLSSRPNTPL